MKGRCSVATAPGVLKVGNRVSAHYRSFVCKVVLTLKDFDMSTVGRDVGYRRQCGRRIRDRRIQHLELRDELFEVYRMHDMVAIAMNQDGGHPQDTRIANRRMNSILWRLQRPVSHEAKPGHRCVCRAEDNAGM